MYMARNRGVKDETFVIRKVRILTKKTAALNRSIYQQRYKIQSFMDGFRSSPEVKSSAIFCEAE